VRNVMIICLVLLSFSNTSHAARGCIQLVSEFLEKKDKDVDVFYYGGHDFADAVFVAEYHGVEIGSLTYDLDRREDHLTNVFIELVRTHTGYRKSGVQDLLYRKVVQLEQPGKISLMMGDTNKTIFLKAMGKHLFPTPFSMIDEFNYTRMVENYLVKNYSSIPRSVLREAAKETPANKSARKLGYKLCGLKLSAAKNRNTGKMFLRIGMTSCNKSY